MATPVWVTGFEHGVASGNGGGLFSTLRNTCTVETGTVHSGTYALKVVNTVSLDSNARFNHAASTKQAVARFYIYIPTGGTPTSTTPVCAWQITTAAVKAGVRLNASTQMSAIVGAGTGTTTIQLAEQTWYCVDMKIDISTSTWTVDWSVNGTAQAQASLSGQSTTDSLGYLQLGSSSTTPMTLLFDDVVLSETYADYPIGAGKTVLLSPSSDGTHNNAANILENQAGSDVDGSVVYAFDLLNDVPLSVADVYMRQAANGTGNYAEINFADLNVGASTYLGTRCLLGYTSATTSANNGATIVSKDSFSTFNDVWGNPTTPADMSDGSTANVYYKSVMVTGANTETLINAVKARMGYSGDANPDPYWINMALEVAYLEADAGALSTTITTTEALSDTIARVLTYARTLTTNEALSDSATRIINYNRTLTTNEALSDLITTLVNRFKTLTSTEAISDLVSATKSSLIEKLLETTEAISDSISTIASFAKLLAESVGITDVIAKVVGYNKSNSDSVGITDVSSDVIGYNRSLFESEGISDTKATASVFSRLLTATEGITDLVDIIVQKVVTLANNVGITDVISGAAGFAKLLTTTEGITDVVSRVSDYIRTFSDTTGITDVISKAVGFAKTLTTNEAISDLITATSGLVASISDSLGITDSVSKVYNSVRTLTSTEGISDSISKAVGYAKDFSDSVGITDIISKSVGFAKTLSNSLGITDFIDAVKESGGTAYNALLQTTEAISDSLSTVRDYVRTVSNDVGITDSINRVINYIRSLSDSISITDIVSRGMQYAITILTTMSLSDIVTAIANFIPPIVPHVKLGGTAGKDVIKSATVDPHAHLSGKN